MTKAQKFHNQHVVRYAGGHWSSEAASSYYAVEYGALRNVYADQACNYSYREFWF